MVTLLPISVFPSLSSNLDIPQKTTLDGVSGAPNLCLAFRNPETTQGALSRWLLCHHPQVRTGQLKLGARDYRGLTASPQPIPLAILLHLTPEGTRPDSAGGSCYLRGAPATAPTG